MSESDVPARLRASLGDRYTVEREAGRGGMATVYLAHDIRHNRRVALKILFPEFAASIGAERFAREIGIAAVLSHPHIVPLYDSGDADGLPFYVMPFIEGESLAARIKRDGALPVGDAVRFAHEVAEALECAHGHGIVHRDIKPDNIMLSGGHAVVTDFGIARAIDAAAGTRVTTAGISVGTPHYMSPEQVFAEEDIDGRTDVYALGCVIFEMLAGRPPFDGATAREIAMRHARDPVPSLAVWRPDVPTQVQAAVERALAKDPAERWATAAAFSHALAGAESSPPTVRQPGARAGTSRRSLAIVAVVAVVVLIAATLGGRALREAGAPRPRADASVVAVLPFRVVGDTTFQYLREGMVDLLSTKFGAMEGLRMVDTRTVLNTWHRSVRTGSEPSAEDARAMASSLGSGRFVLGDVVATPRGLSFTARLLDADGVTRATAHGQGPADSLFALVDQLALELLASSAGEPGRRLADLSTTSIAAVRAYLAGRAALRRGETARAIRSFSEALEIDSTFALAALGMASSGAWSQQAGQTQALRRGLRTGYALRNRLSRRDQLLFEALVLPGDPSEHTAARQLAGWQRAADAAQESADAQYEYGDRLYHTGTFLGVSDAVERATASFSRTLALDSALGQPLGHLVEIAAHVGDRARTREMLGLYMKNAAAADAGDYVQWRAAVALDDRATLARLRERRTEAATSAVLRIVGFGQAEGVAMQDVEVFASELRRRALSGLQAGSTFHSAQTLHSWAMNRGSVEGQQAAIAMVRAAEPIASGFSIVYFDADQIAVLDNLFWDGDSSSARKAVARLDEKVARAAPAESGPRAQYLTDLCVTLLWARVGGHTPARADGLTILRRGAAPQDSSGMSGGNPALCVMMLDALASVREHDARAGGMVARLDSTMLAAPFQFGVDFGNIMLARLYEEQHDIPSALRVIRRRPYDWDTAPLYLTTFLFEEARLAALAGDDAGAARARLRYTTLRAGAARAATSSKP